MLGLNVFVVVFCIVEFGKYIVYFFSGDEDSVEYNIGWVEVEVV